MTPAERVARALALGRRDREIFRAGHGLTAEAGRRRSRCLEELIG